MNEMSKVDRPRPTPQDVVNILVELYDYGFGGKSSGKYRISRKYLRMISERRKVSPDFLEAIAEEMFERGYVFIDLESYFAVSSQKLLNGYRQVTNRIIVGIVHSNDDDSGGPRPTKRRRRNGNT